jgi:hypothetical protein
MFYRDFSARISARLVAAGLFIGVVANARSALLIENLSGPVTANEIRAFKEYMRTIPPPTNNFHNNMVYGPGGQAAEALGDIYEITKDREILDMLINSADHMLAARNNPVTGRVLWTGKRDLVWPNTPSGTYSATENGDVLAHIGYAAKCILETKPLWNEKVSFGDPDGFGATYLGRARTFVRESDRTMDTFIIPWMVRTNSNRLYNPDSDLFGRGSNRPVPWNQQMMLAGGFQRLAECHDLLGDDPGRMQRYDAVVQASLDWFFSDATSCKVNGRECYGWSYVSEGRSLKHVEDTPHAQYDILIYRAYESGRYRIDRENMIALANTIAQVISKGNGQFASRVNGTGQTRDYLGGGFLHYAQFLPGLYPLIAQADLDRAKTSPDMTAAILQVKYYRDTKRFPTN